MNKEGKFQKKLWCCISGGEGNLVLSNELINVNWFTVYSFKADVSSCSSSSEQSKDSNQSIKRHIFRVLKENLWCGI